ncbi:hypothetical protein C7T35_36350 [Variovorax sp. WS11]|nr:hypothetical protein C7T35_36350 [Variovorax sp. WS11]
MRDWPPSDAEEGLRLGDFIAQYVKEGEVDQRRCYADSGYGALNAATTHGTHVMDLAAGYPDPLLPPGKMPAPPPTDEDIVFVQLPRHFNGRQTAGLLRAQVVDAIRYIFSRAADHAAVTINLSYGSNAGPHDGSSLLERALDDAIEARRARGGSTDIVIPAGNSRNQDLHMRLEVGKDELQKIIWQNIPHNPTTQFIEIWLDTAGNPHDCQIRVSKPQEAWPAAQDGWIEVGQMARIEENNELIAMVVAPERVCQSPNGRMILVAVAPTGPLGNRAPAPYGDWTFEIRNTGTEPVTVNAWCERDDPVFGSGGSPRQARFQHSNETGTLNSIAHGQQTVIVGGIVGMGLGGGEASYSGQGPLRCFPTSRNLRSSVKGIAKARPDILAISDESPAEPGLAAAAVIGYGSRLSGTSMAAAVVTRMLVAEKRI